MSKSKFKITEFKNPAGSKAWKLSGTLNGKRIRENYKTRAAAVEQRQRYDIELMNELSDGQTVWTTLTQQQNRDAIAAVNRLKQTGSKKTLDFAVSYMLEHYRETSEVLTVSQAVAEYLEAKEGEVDRKIISDRQYGSISSEMETLKLVFPDRIVSEIQAKDLEQYLEGKLPNARRATSMKTWNNRRGYLSTFFKFCIASSQGYVAHNPVTEIRQFKIKARRGTAETLSAQDAADLMAFLETYKREGKRARYQQLEGCMVPYFALALFAGIRPDWKNGEISKLSRKDIRLDTEVILVEPEVSKVHEKRTVFIQPNLKLWLERYPLSRFPILPKHDVRYMVEELRQKFALGHDVLRHTFISMTVGAFRSVGDASLQAGNSEAVIRKHYLDLKSVGEADQFWQIVPKGEKLPKMEKKEGRYVPFVA